MSNPSLETAMTSFPPAIRIGLYVLLLLAGVVALHLAQIVILPLLISLLLATVLGPAAVWLQEKLKIRWFLACITVVIGLVLANLLIFLMFFSSVASVVARMTNEEKIIDMYKKMRNNLEKVSPIQLDPEVFPPDPKKEDQIFEIYKAMREKVAKAMHPTLLKEEDYPADPKGKLKVDEAIQKYKEMRARLERLSPAPIDERAFPKEVVAVQQIRIFQYIIEAAPSLLARASIYGADWGWQVILVLFTTFFVLLEGKMLARRVVAIFGPSEEIRSKASEVLDEMAAQVRNYLVWRTIINLGLAVIMGVIFQLFGLGQAWTWAILLAILNYIPYIGPVLASIPPFLEAFIASDNPVVPIIIMMLYWGVVLIEGWLIVPLLMGRSMDLNATTVMLACLFWPLVWGPAGLFLAMPIMAGIKAILYNVPELRAWAELMSSTEDDAQPQILITPSANGTNGVVHTDGPLHPEEPRRIEGDVK